MDDSLVGAWPQQQCQWRCFKQNETLNSTTTTNKVYQHDRIDETNSIEYSFVSNKQKLNELWTIHWLGHGHNNSVNGGVLSKTKP